MVFPVVMYGYELDHKESWAPKNRCFWTVVLEKTLASSLDCKEIKPVHPKGDQSWIFTERTDAEAEAPILWPPNVKSWLIGKDPDAGKDWRQEENEVVGWHHPLHVHEFEQAPGIGDGQRSLACCSPWRHRVGHDWATELNWLNNNRKWGIWRTSEESLADGSHRTDLGSPLCKRNTVSVAASWIIVLSVEENWTHLIT